MWWTQRQFIFSILPFFRRCYCCFCSFSWWRCVCVCACAGEGRDGEGGIALSTKSVCVCVCVCLCGCVCVVCVCVCARARVRLYHYMTFLFWLRYFSVSFGRQLFFWPICSAFNAIISFLSLTLGTQSSSFHSISLIDACNDNSRIDMDCNNDITN